MIGLRPSQLSSCPSLLSGSPSPLSEVELTLKTDNPRAEDVGLTTSACPLVRLSACPHGVVARAILQAVVFDGEGVANVAEWRSWPRRISCREGGSGSDASLM